MNASCVRSRASASFPVRRKAKLYVALPYWSIACSRDADASREGGSIGLRGTPIGIRAFGAPPRSASRADASLLAEVRRRNDDLRCRVLAPGREGGDVAQILVEVVGVV